MWCDNFFFEFASQMLTYDSLFFVCTFKFLKFLQNFRIKFFFVAVNYEPNWLQNLSHIPACACSITTFYFQNEIHHNRKACFLKQINLCFLHAIAWKWCVRSIFFVILLHYCDTHLKNAFAFWKKCFEAFQFTSQTLTCDSSF